VRDDLKKESILGWSNGRRRWEEEERALLLFLGLLPDPTLVPGDDERLDDMVEMIIMASYVIR
jgi:hypothetical protein